MAKRATTTIKDFPLDDLIEEAWLIESECRRENPMRALKVAAIRRRIEYDRAQQIAERDRLRKAASYHDFLAANQQSRD